MKKTLTKMVAVVMVAVFSLGLFAANSFASTAKKTAPAKVVKPAWMQNTKPITFDWYINFSWFGTKWKGSATADYITKKTGVSINYVVPAGNESEKLNTMLASGKLPDFITLGWWEDAVKKMIEGGLVLPLNKLADKYDMYFYKVADAQKLSWYKQADGNVYGYPNASSSSNDFSKYIKLKPSNETFLVRKDMWEALGKPDMRTPDGFRKALEMAKQKFPEVDGQPLIPLGLCEFTDTYTANSCLEDYLRNFLAVPRAVNGKLYDGVTDPEYLRWLKTLRKVNEEGLLAKDVFVDKRAQMEEKIAQGRYFAMLYQRSDFAAQEQALYAKDKNKVYIAIDGPANSKLGAPKLPGDGISGWTVTLISKACKDPQRAIAFMSYLISPEGEKDMFLGPKGVTYDTIKGKDQFKPEVLKLLNTDRTAFDKKYGASYTHWMLMDTNMSLAWAPPAVEPQKQMMEWTLGKTVSYAEFDNIDPTGDSDEGVANNNIAQLWGKTLPQLLMAGSDAEFDKIFKDFVAQRKDLGFDIVQAYRQKQYELNKKKLGMK